MNVAPFSTLFTPTQPLVDPKTGKPTTTSYSFLLQLFNRGGAGTGIMNKVGTDLVATGNAMISALPLSNDWNLLAVVPAGSGVQLPATMAPGSTCKVRNNDANNLNVYPPTVLFEIDALGDANPYVLAPNTEKEFECWTTTQLYSR